MRRTNDVDVAVLMRGSHSHPRRGACLVELASTLPGGPWTDRPSCVPPVLAWLGTIVNDASSPAGRRGLVGFAPWLVGTTLGATADPVGPAVAALAGRAALSRADPASASRLAPALATLGTELSSAPGVWSRLQRRRRIRRVVRLAVRTLGRRPDRDDVLRDVLLASINLIRQLDGLPELALPDLTLPPTACPPTLSVRLQLCSPDGAESTYVHCTALVDRWPQALRAAWIARQAELAMATPAPPSALISRS